MPPSGSRTRWKTASSPPRTASSRLGPAHVDVLLRGGRPARPDRPAPRGPGRRPGRPRTSRPSTAMVAEPGGRSRQIEPDSAARSRRRTSSRRRGRRRLAAEPIAGHRRSAAARRRRRRRPATAEPPPSSHRPRRRPRPRRDGRAGGAGDGGEPLAADGPGGRIAGPVAAAPAVRRLAARAQEPADGADRDAAGARGPADGEPSATRRSTCELLARARPQAGQCVAGARPTRSRRSRTSPGAARTSPAGCITRSWPAGCGRWPTASAASPGWSATSPGSWASRSEFEVVGETTGVDRDILDKLEAPLNHLIRNALDHAIEPPDERAAAGKPAGGDDPARGPPPRGDAPDHPERRRPGDRPGAAPGQGRRAGPGHRRRWPSS